MTAESLIFDIETNGLLHELDRLHCIQLGSVAGTDVTVYCDALPGYRPLSEGLARISSASKLIGHNVLSFDFRAIEKLYPGTLKLSQMVDTLVMCQMFDPEEKMQRLSDWGQRLGVMKGDFEGPWEVCTPAMLEYAAQDVVVTRALYKHVREVETWGTSLDTYTKFAWGLVLQETNGFRLDVPKAQALEAELRGELAVLTEEARHVFPPLWVREGTLEKSVFTPKGNNRTMGYTAGVPFTRVKLQEFNPGSRKQVADRLIRLGWKPAKFGKDGVPTLNDELLAAMPWPEARALVRLFTVTKMLGQIADGDGAWLKKVGTDGRCHGRQKTVGCAPGRSSHSGPNMAQVSKRDKRMREVWLPREGWLLVGCDGSAIQARGLAHYLAPYDGGAAIDREINGRKEEETDTHSLNRKALEGLGLKVPDRVTDPEAIAKLKGKLRDGAKTALYAVLFGASDPKLGLTIKEQCRKSGVPVPGLPLIELGRLARRQLFRAIKGFEPMETKIKSVARSPKKGGKGYLTCLDGFHIRCRSDHSALVFLLQGFEQSIMKLANVVFHFEVAPGNGWEHGRDYGFVADVHDERQIEARPEIAESLGRAYADCIAEAGRRLGSRCPMEGSFDIGPNWAATH